MQKTAKKIWNAITTVLVSVVVVLAMLLWGLEFFGLNIYVVQSGSMEPAYHVGSLVYVKPVEAETLQIGDVITFHLGDGIRGTHRIIEVKQENGEPAFRTKGDANDVEDNNLVTPEELIGKVIFTIPYLGFLVAYVQQPPGTYVAVSAVGMLLLLTVLPDIIFPERKDKDK